MRRSCGYELSTDDLYYKDESRERGTKGEKEKDGVHRENLKEDKGSKLKHTQTLTHNAPIGTLSADIWHRKLRSTHMKTSCSERH